MTKEQTKKAIKKQINKLNESIDLKIINGKNYTKEMKEHSDLRLFLKHNFA